MGLRILFVALLGLSIVNCGGFGAVSSPGLSPTRDQAYFDSLERPAVVPGSRTVPVDLNPGSTYVVVNQYKPVLAVRGAACMICHAKVKSSIVTDFGFGSDFYFNDGFNPNLNPNLAMPYYNHFNGETDQYGAWKTAHIKGSVLVPKAPVPQQMKTFDPSRLLSTFGRSSLAEYLQLVLQQPSGAVPRYGPINGAEKVDIGLVMEKQSVYIGAPTATEIRADSASAGAALTYIPRQGARATSLSGLVLQPGGYLQNTGPIQCEGDLVLETTLFLNNAAIETTSGCGIYSTRPIFVQGALTAVGASELRHIQLISSNAVIFGMSPSTLATRFYYSYPIRQATTALQIDAFKADLLAEAGKIVGLVDAGAVTGQGTDQNFDRLLVMAPHVHSRYTGQFKGFLIAEIAIFRIGFLQFSLDSVFEKVAPFPLFKNRSYVSVN